MQFRTPPQRLLLLALVAAALGLIGGGAAYVLIKLIALLTNLALFHRVGWVDVPLSPRGEYEITDAVSALAARRPFYAVEATVWLPIGTVEAWRAAEGVDLERVLLGE